MYSVLKGAGVPGLSTAYPLDMFLGIFVRVSIQ